MNKLEKQAARLNLWSALIERSLKVLDVLGLRDKLGGAIVIIAVPLWGWGIQIVDGLSFWMAWASGLLLAALTLQVYVALRKAWSVRGLKTIDLAYLGAECRKFQTDLFEFLVARVDVAPLRHSDDAFVEDPAKRGAVMHAEWARMVAFNGQTRARIAQKFAHRALSLCALLRDHGISPPDLWSFDHEAATFAAEIGAIGELLERGLYKEARAFNPKAERLQIYIG